MKFFFLKKKRKSEKVFDTIFVLAGITTFVLLFLLFSIFKFNLLNLDLSEISQENENKIGISIKKYSFLKAGDPFITKNDKLDDNFLVSPILNDSTDPSLGPDEARLTIVEFSDFTCEFCQKQETIIREVAGQYKSLVRLVWKNYPEPSGISLQAAVAGHCAHKQGKFWQYHDLLFEKANDLDSDLFLKLAKKLDLNENDFSSCIKNEKSFEKIMENIREAEGLRITGVPFFFVGSQEILGEISREDLKRIIDQSF